MIEHFTWSVSLSAAQLWDGLSGHVLGSYLSTKTSLNGPCGQVSHREGRGTSRAGSDWYQGRGRMGPCSESLPQGKEKTSMEAKSPQIGELIMKDSEGPLREMPQRATCVPVTQIMCSDVSQTVWLRPLKVLSCVSMARDSPSRKMRNHR